MIGWRYHVFRKVQIIYSIIEREIFIYLENNDRNFKLEEWIKDIKKLKTRLNIFTYILRTADLYLRYLQF